MDTGELIKFLRSPAVDKLLTESERRVVDDIASRNPFFLRDGDHAALRRVYSALPLLQEEDLNQEDHEWSNATRSEVSIYDPDNVAEDYDGDRSLFIDPVRDDDDDDE